MSNKPQSINENTLMLVLLILISILFIILVVLVCKIIQDWLRDKDNNIKDENDQILINQEIEKSDVLQYTLNFLDSENGLKKHHLNQSTRYIYLSNQIANHFNKDESESSKFRDSIYLACSNKNSRMLMTEEVKTIASFIDEKYEQIEIGSTNIAEQIKEFENNQAAKDRINKKIALDNQTWKNQCEKIKQQNKNEESRINKLNEENKNKIDATNNQLIKNYKISNPEFFQINQTEEKKDDARKDIRSKLSLWNKFLILLKLNKVKVSPEENIENQPLKQKEIDITKIPGYQKFIPQSPNLQSLPEKPTDEGSPALLGNQLQGQYILQKKIYECINDGLKSKLVIRVPGHYFHIKIERANEDSNDKSINVIIADSAGSGSRIQNHIQYILKNGLDFIDGEERYTDGERDSTGEEFIKFRQKNIKLSKEQIKINIIQDEKKAMQGGGYECGLFSIYNGNREFFNEMGVDHTKMSKNDFNKKLHLAIYALHRASLIYGYFETAIVWDLEASNVGFNAESLHQEILNETKAICKTFLENFEKYKEGELTPEKYNEELEKFDKNFYSATKQKIQSKLVEITNLDENFLNKIQEILNKEIIEGENIEPGTNSIHKDAIGISRIENTTEV